MCHSLLQSSESVGHNLSREVDRGKVGELHVERTGSSPSALVVKLAQTELVHPHLTRLGSVGYVSHSDDHRLHLAERGISHHRYLVVGLVAVVFRIGMHIGGLSGCLLLVALLLDGGQLVEGYVEHVLLGPHCHPSLVRVAVVILGSQFQRYLVFIVVALVVASESHEDGQLVVLQVRGVLLHGVGMHKHLQTLVLAQVEVGVLIHRLCLALCQLLDDESERLLVVLHELRLRGVGHTAYSRRQHIVHGLLVGVLLDVDICCFEFAGGCGGGVGEVLLVCAPFSSHEVETTEA